MEQSAVRILKTNSPTPKPQLTPLKRGSAANWSHGFSKPLRMGETPARSGDLHAAKIRIRWSKVDWLPLVRVQHATRKEVVNVKRVNCCLCESVCVE